MNDLQVSGNGPRGERRHWVQLGLLCGLVLLFLWGGCRSKGQGPETDTPVAAVNGEAIAGKAFLERLGGELALVQDSQRLTTEVLDALKGEILNDLIEERLILQRARALGLGVAAVELENRIEEIRRDYGDEGFKSLFGPGGVDQKAWQEALRRRLLIEKVVSAEVNARVVVNEAEAERHYLAQREAYGSEERLQIQQIVVHERAQAEGVLKRLMTGEDFAKVARDVSIGPEGARGGDLGLVERGVMPEAIDRVIFSLAVDKLSRVVESPYGFHIFKVLKRQEKGGRTFAEARSRVIAEVRKAKEAEAYGRWIEELRAKASIEIRRPLPDVPAAQAPRVMTPWEESGKNE